MRFPLWERMEMAFMWAWALIVIALLTGWGTGRWAMVSAAVVSIVAVVGGVFAALPHIVVTGPKRWLTFSTFAAGGCAMGAAVLAAQDAATAANLWPAAVAATVAMSVLCIDLAGTTPWYSSSINSFRNEAHIELVAQRCTGAGDCVAVCPREVLEMNSLQGRVEIRRADQCIQCGACIVQCPADALRFRFDDNRVVEAAAIRRTRMNLLGRRTIEVPD
jgi:NAD-dependent dihydropyrimidine dehydrogenase PreA subunit